ncbi:MAG TPA: undecaprenyl-phosphate galactose phosphotransferase WbaP [Bryobacteraceae bacterium]|nr:undecaprenyl-phosphate galactose phosphotransferase WbaP [Bryobacteraceae bacterium]
MSTLHPQSLAVRPARKVELRAEASIARPRACIAILLLADFVALCLGAALSVLIWRQIGLNFITGFYVKLWPVLLLFPLAYAASGLYPGFGRNPADELRKLSAATSVVYGALAVTIFLLKDAATYSRGTFLLAWGDTLILVPLLRSVVRSVCARKPWWGKPVVIVGARNVTGELAAVLDSQPSLGFKPVAVVEEPRLAELVARDRGIRHVILAMAEIPRETLRIFFEECSDSFSDVIVIPDLAGFSSLWAEPRDLRGTLGLEIQQKLLIPRSRVLKRAIDLLLVAVSSIVALPFIVVIAVLIRITSPGPAFFGQRRYGRKGEPFMAWKFRSMAADASHVLEQCLTANPALREEWRRSHKLRNDPRVTRLGHFLRRTSLDELPQLWNILRGQMSFVGPRPIVAEEIPRYGDGYFFYKKVTPGLTGLWQVSGRTNTSYEQRVSFDLYYVRNWSVWLDLHVLARTVRVVLLGDGAC